MQSITPVVSQSTFPLAANTKIDAQFLQNLQNAAKVVIKENASSEELETNIQILRDAQTRLNTVINLGQGNSELENVLPKLGSLIDGIDQKVNIGTLKELAHPLFQALQPLVLTDITSTSAIQSIGNIKSIARLDDSLIEMTRSQTDILIDSINYANDIKSSGFPYGPAAKPNASDRNTWESGTIGKDNVRELNDSLYDIHINIKALKHMVDALDPEQQQLQEIITSFKSLLDLYNKLNLDGFEDSRKFKLLLSDEMKDVNQLMRIFNYRYKGGDDDGTQLLKATQALRATIPDSSKNITPVIV